MLRALAIVVLGVWGAVGFAQQPDQAPATATAPAILTVDLERLFEDSDFGQRLEQEQREAAEALGLENTRIIEALRAEELALTEARPDMDPDVFQQEAEAFDEKAQAIRRAQDAKQREVENLVAAGRVRFFEIVGPVLRQLAIDRGASAILDGRAVLISIDGTDVTDEAIARINASLGDGSSASEN